MSSTNGDKPAVNLTLISHTNAGKTTLLRTLVRRDVGEVADRAHVTSSAEAHVLIETPEGDVLRLWDTPGFGDSVRLLKRLRMSSNPVGWFLTQVWDRLTDRAFFSSQIAIRSVREHTDVVLYLVNAAEDPGSATYVGVELQILGWVGKPVLVLLNQMGAPKPRDLDAMEEAAWRRHLEAHAYVAGPVVMDAFARCWVQEDRLLSAVAEIVQTDKGPAFERIRATWRSRNLSVFEQSMDTLAKQLAARAVDREAREAPGFTQKLVRWVKSGRTKSDGADLQMEHAIDALAQRLAASVRDTTNHLIALHGLSGRSEKLILERLAGDADVLKASLDVGDSGVLGGLVAGAATGLTADLVAGGLTFGAGALVGGIVGALGGAGAAHAYNLARDADGLHHVGWSRKFLTQRVQAALLRYLAIAHFGRGRGDWAEGEYPKHWQELVAELVLNHAKQLDEVWSVAQGQAAFDEVAGRLRPLVTASARVALVRLYPDSADVFALGTASNAAAD